MYGEGKTRGQVTELKIEATCNQACAAISVNETLANKDFVKIRLQENYEEVRKMAVGGAQPNLNLEKVREISICLPSMEEQAEIVRRVGQLFAFTDQLEALISVARARIERLPQSILAKAFRGELVPQEPNDEPASALLERIKAQRAAATKPKRGRKALA
jgi:type I restriction enzyme S subunit